MTSVSANATWVPLKSHLGTNPTPLFTVKYHYLKGAIVGPMYKIPFMGPFLESVNPQFTKYKAKWDSGDLSCVSVFHK